MQVLDGITRCPSCGGRVMPSTSLEVNGPKAFTCIFCPAAICSWCGARYTVGHAVADGLPLPTDPRAAVGSPIPTLPPTARRP